MARVSKKRNVYIQPQLSANESDRELYQTAIYARLSVEDNGKDSDSLEAQVQYLKLFLEDKPQMELRWIFTDNGFSGTNYERPEFQKMMDLVRAGRINCIIVKDLSRLGRNYIDTGNFLQKICPLLNLRLIAVNDRYDTAFAGTNEEMSMSVLNIVNDMYAKDISRKICSSLQGKMERGEYIGNYAPYGYEKDPENKNHLIVDPVTAPVVRRIYELRASGIGVMKIAAILNEAGIPSPGRYRYERGIITNNNKKGKELLWNRHVLMDLLKNVVYIGHLAQARSREALHQGVPFHWTTKEEWVVCQNTHEAVIDKALYVRVQEINQSRTAAHKENSGKYDYLPKAVNPYGKKLVCADCGSAMKLVRSISKKKDKAYFTFKCPRYMEHGRRGCRDKAISQTELDQAVISTVRTHIHLLAEHKPVIKRLMEQKKKEESLGEGEKEIQKTEQEIRRRETLRNGLYMDFKNGILTEEEYRYTKQKYGEDIERLKNQIEEHRNRQKEKEDKADPYAHWLSLIDCYEHTEEVNSQLVEALIEEVRVYEEKHIEIKLKYMDSFRKYAAMDTASRAEGSPVTRDRSEACDWKEVG